MKIDMSAEAVTARLRRVSQLRRLCLLLGKATPVEPDKPAAPAPGPIEAQRPGRSSPDPES